MEMTTRQTLAWLGAFESPNVTYIEPDGSWPIVWQRARGVHVWDAEGRKYLDLTAAFGVAAAGHANRGVVRAGQQQMGRLLHAMGDVHPHALKAQLARELSRITFERWTKGRLPDRRRGAEGQRQKPRPTLNAPHSRSYTGKTIFCNSGFEAVEAALKTAMLATSKPGVIAFQGAYHGLGYGALNATQRDHFRGPFRSQLGEFGHFVAFPENAGDLDATEAAIRRLARRHRIGAILVEPIQARGGVNIPPPGFLPLLRHLAEACGALLILDEIYTGFGRTGKWFACEYTATVPDVICLGKALTGGFPLSACVGRAEIMDAAWPRSSGEAIHTSTFLGHPVGCAMALAQLAELRTRRLVQRSAQLGVLLLDALSALIPSLPNLILSARGLGLLAGLELRSPAGQPATGVALGSIKAMLGRGFILLPEGEHANVISFSPSLTISAAQLQATIAALAETLTATRPE
jgi:4-aminobutyrate aminotransferase-like enzyme